MKCAFAIDDRYFADDGTLTAVGLESGRWLDVERARGAEWKELAGELEVHIRVAEHLYRTWCGLGDGTVSDAQCPLF
ncbi:hypothetical protein [Rhodococcoides corynebacterioides]|jgi:hypothetical protein|uniref:hypothetical protein n=1 Tax=Rhodococcoides corynebacterioides TaxID=53972 RepID=UPI001C9B3D7D|nr:hypothetical protein [Rhodococcus corynebacterioides]MBY6352048.1 hypothetical protein [Rhodococcus corynebacterioides]